MDDSTLSDILEALMQSGDQPDRQLADQYIKQNPELAIEIAEFLLAWERDIVGGASAMVEESTLNAQSIATIQRSTRDRLNLPQANEAEPAANTQATNPFSALKRDQLAVLAKNLRVRKSFLSKLRDRQIELESIPQRFLSALAKQMGADPRVIREHLMGEPRLFGGLEFKSRAKPQVTQKQTFESALRSPLAQSAIDYWLDSEDGNNHPSNGSES